MKLTEDQYQRLARRLIADQLALARPTAPWNLTEVALSDLARGVGSRLFHLANLGDALAELRTKREAVERAAGEATRSIDERIASAVDTCSHPVTEHAGQDLLGPDHVCQICGTHV
jgi:hypothetical protein